VCEEGRAIGLQRGRTGRQAPGHPVATSHKTSARWPAHHLVHLAARRRACPFHKRFAAEGSRERTWTGRHQPAPWQPRLDPRRAFRALTFCLRRFRGVASFQSLLRTSIFRKQFSHSCCWSRRDPSCIFRVAVRTMEANMTRLCRRLHPTARFSCLLRLRSLENEDFTSKTALSQLLLLTGLPTA